MFTRNRIGWMVLPVVLMMAAATVWAADAGVAVVIPERGMSLGELFTAGGPLMYVLAAISVVALALVIYCFVVLRPDSLMPRGFRREIIAKINAGAWGDVRAACIDKPSPLSEIVLAALEHAESAPKLDPSLLKDVIEGEGSRQAIDIQGEAQYLLDVAVVAPMVGLLGTVFGMIRAFNVVALDMAKAKPMLLASGVSEALITTAAGLIIGIPAMIFFAYFRGRASKLVSRLEATGSEILTAFLRARGA